MSGERDLSPRIARIAARAWFRIPLAVRNELFERGVKMVEIDPLPDRLADAGADNVIRLCSNLPGGELGEFIVSHEVCHLWLGHPGPALRDEAKRAACEDEADRLAYQWGFRKDEPRQVWVPGGTSGSFWVVNV